MSSARKVVQSRPPSLARSRASGPRKCSGTRVNGEKCKANAIKGSKFCIGHDPVTKAKADAKAHAPEARAKAAATREANKVPRELDLLAKKLNDNADEIVEQLLEIARNAQKAVVVHGSRDTPGWVEMVPDDDLRLKAINALYDRIHGRPGQGITISGNPEAPLAVAPRREPEHAQQVAEILARQGALPRHEGRRRRGSSEPTNGAVHQG